MRLLIELGLAAGRSLTKLTSVRATQAEIKPSASQETIEASLQR